MGRKLSRSIKDFSTVKLIKRPGPKPLPVNDPVLLSFIRKALQK